MLTALLYFTHDPDEMHMLKLEQHLEDHNNIQYRLDVTTDKLGRIVQSLYVSERDYPVAREIREKLFMRLAWDATQGGSK